MWSIPDKWTDDISWEITVCSSHTLHKYRQVKIFPTSTQCQTKSRFRLLRAFHHPVFICQLSISIRIFNPKIAAFERQRPWIAILFFVSGSLLVAFEQPIYFIYIKRLIGLSDSINHIAIDNLIDTSQIQQLILIIGEIRIDSHSPILIEGMIPSKACFHTTVP